MGDRRLRGDAVAEVEDVRQPLGRRQDGVHGRVQGPPALDQRLGVEVALSHRRGRHTGAQGREIDPPIDADGIRAGLGDDAGMALETRAAGEDDDLRIRHLRADALDHPRDRTEGEALERVAVARSRQHAGMGLEDLHRVGAGAELAHEVLGLDGDQPVEQRIEKRRIGSRQRPGRGEIRRAAPADHVARDRPRRAAEAEQRGLVRQRPADPLHRLEDRRQMRKNRRVARLAQALELRPAFERVEARPLAFDEAHVLAQGVGHHEDVGEQDRGLEAEAADRLERHLGGEGRIVAEIEEGAGFRPGRPVFRQVPAGLAHHPGRGRGDRLA